MGTLRVVVLWHQHQPYYKDLVSGEYRLPWTRMHALKDYYGMVKLLDEFPTLHQTFNLVPSLMVQIQDYADGTASDPFLRVAAKPAKDLTPEERRFALQYLFQANPVNQIGRYPRYRELWEQFRASGDSPEKAGKYFQAQEYTDLQVLSQLAWFDEFFLEDPEVAALVKKQRNYTLEDQAFVIAQERELIGRILPAHAKAAERGGIEISTSPFYHPILPLVCDTNAGAHSSPGLPLPQNRYQRPDDAREQMVRGLDLHEKVMGKRPRGMWPSEGSVSDEVLAIAAHCGVKWMATDEGVLGRSLGVFFARDGGGRLPQDQAHKLYNVYRYEKAGTGMKMIFRDHTLSDLIGFVYSGMKPQEAAGHLLKNIREAAQPVLDSGRDAMVPIILDGENAWEYYPKSGREFLRRFYEGLQNEPGLEAVTVSEAVERHRDPAELGGLVPGSWISANFNVWIGAPEDNKAWDYLYQARKYYEEHAGAASEAKRKLAYEEILIAEGSDWNWWYGPEHHSANDRDFDALYRKHLSNVYQALGGVPPDYLAQPISGEMGRPSFTPQSAYIRPKVTGEMIRYFEWMGAARYTSDQRSGAMHGKQFLLDSVYAGIDESNVYGRLDFAGKVPQEDFDVVVNLEAWAQQETKPRRAWRLGMAVAGGRVKSWQAEQEGEKTASAGGEARAALEKNFEFSLPLAWLDAVPMPPETLVAAAEGQPAPVSRVRLRFSLWENGLPVDALPLEGWIELAMVTEENLEATDY